MTEIVEARVSQGRVIVSAPLPPSVNRLYATDRKTGRRFKTEEARLYVKAIREGMLVARVEARKIEPPFSVNYYVHHQDRRRRDISNHIKVIEDAVMDAIDRDDRLVVQMSVWKYLADEPGITMTVEHTDRDYDIRRRYDR